MRALPRPFCLQLPPVKALQLGIAPHGMHRRLTPQKAQERIALFGEPSQSLTSAARVFTGDHPHVTRQRFAVYKSRRIPEEDVGGQRRDVTDTEMRREHGRARALRGGVLHSVVKRSTCSSNC